MSEEAETIPFQAVILCGPGSSFPTFTTNSDQNPKALLPIANRPMVWYAIDFCRRMLITDITLIVPPSSYQAIKTALHSNPQLTFPGLATPNLLAPKDLDNNTSTAQIFRLPEVRDIIKGNFLTLPCDLICELSGETFLDLWAVQACRPGGNGHAGGLGVWYQTKGETVIKETGIFGANRYVERHQDDKKSLPLRHSLLRAHPRLKMLSSHRDAHIYFFPAWILDLINQNEELESIGEDVLGWWAKAGWQEGLSQKLHLDTILNLQIATLQK
ncbi:nucleotide-diphospho-sugar transferase [Bisporella sp. PMI_857]|nr:nucleotide-diphospho-sugar transferase [Bisporella sp. PMI_857]